MGCERCESTEVDTVVPGGIVQYLPPILLLNMISPSFKTLTDGSQCQILVIPPRGWCERAHGELYV